MREGFVSKETYYISLCEIKINTHNRLLRFPKRERMKQIWTKYICKQPPVKGCKHEFEAALKLYKCGHHVTTFLRHIFFASFNLCLHYHHISSSSVWTLNKREQLIFTHTSLGSYTFMLQSSIKININFNKRSWREG